VGIQPGDRNHQRTGLAVAGGDVHLLLPVLHPAVESALKSVEMKSAPRALAAVAVHARFLEDRLNVIRKSQARPVRWRRKFAEVRVGGQAGQRHRGKAGKHGGQFLIHAFDLTVCGFRRNFKMATFQVLYFVGGNPLSGLSMLI
jgi:hypothetical protein